MRFSLRSKLLIFCITILVVFGGAVFYTVNSQVTKLATNDILKMLYNNLNLGLSLLNQTYEGDWSIKDSKLYKGDKIINEDYTIVDELMTQTKSASSIFMGDTRISTNLYNEDGSRAIGTKLSEKVISEVLKKGNTYIGEADVLGMKYEAIYVPIKDINENVLGVWSVGVEKSTIQRDINKLSLYIGIVILIALLIGIIVVVLFTNSLIRGINKILTVLKEISNGNFGVKAEVKNNDEIGLIAGHLNNMTDNVGRLIKNIREMSLTVASSSQEMMASSEEVSKASEQVAIAIQEVARGSSEQALSVERGNGKVKEISDGLQQIADEMDSSKNLAIRAKETVDAGEKSIGYQSQKMTENSRVSENVAAAITKLSQKSSEIGQMLEVIKSISDQTNLLALNAAIEAARAGEQGKGFAVVADEIRKLAEQSGASAKRIDEMVASIQADIGDTVSEMEKAKIVVGEQAKALADTVAAFDDIAKMVDQIAEDIEAVSESTTDLSQNAKQVEEEMVNISSVAQETAAGTEEVAASTEEQTSITQQITLAAENLAQLANSLQEQVNKFNI